MECGYGKFSRNQFTYVLSHKFVRVMAQRTEEEKKEGIYLRHTLFLSTFCDIYFHLKVVLTPHFWYDVHKCVMFVRFIVCIIFIQLEVKRYGTAKL